MKLLKRLPVLLFAASFLAAATLALGAESKEKKKEAKVKPYTLPTCAVSGEKLGGMGETYTFTHQGREIKLCCQSCEKDFKKDPAKYVKKIEQEEKKAVKKEKR